MYVRSCGVREADSGEAESCS
ncbi:hypothetical protein LINPERPRIM_LOCUS12780 [Linum perenne]